LFLKCVMSIRIFGFDWLDDMIAVSPFAPERFPKLPILSGVRLATHACGLHYQDRDDLLVAALRPGTVAAGVLTQSTTAAAPVHWCRRLLARGDVRGLVVNAGNANAFTGDLGTQAVELSVDHVARVIGCQRNEVYTASTGVIGVPMPMDKMSAAFDVLSSRFHDDAWEAAARAIMTTDTYPKAATRSKAIDGVGITVNGIAKGSGMIAPDMATMLAFVFTDAAIAKAPLQAALSRAVGPTFNSITVDSDTSTSDTLLAFATGGADHAPIVDVNDPRLGLFEEVLRQVLQDLAWQVVKDGEGISKFVAVSVKGAEDDAAAKRIALSIANSPLVKTAIAGSDANWGRIVMAVGKAGERANRDRIAIRIGGVPVAEMSRVVPGYDESPVAAHMKGREIDICVDVGIASGTATVWTCDLTHAYIEINADYRS
jgi:glutamate N-acetyltransferase/amino-acid N-acetyltransferase